MDGKKERQMLILLISACTLVVIIAILLIISIWINAGREEEIPEHTIGTISKTEVTKEDYIERYYLKIQDKLLIEDYKALYEYLGEDYKEYTKMTEESLKAYLTDKKIIGQHLLLQSYEVVSVQGFSNVYVMNIKLKEGIYDLNVVVREKSPNNFTIAFDEFIKSEETQINNTLNGVNLSIDKITQFSNYIEYDLTIKNLHDKDIILNYNNMSENIHLKLSNDSLVSPFATVLGGTKVTIKPDRIKQYKIRYKVENSNMKFIESIVIKDIYYEGKGVTSDAEFLI